MDQIDKLNDNLPKTDERIESAFNDCLKEKRIIEKVKTFVEVSNENYKYYVESALKALNAAKTLLENGNFGWVIVPAYSAIFQAGNAVLIKELGKECRDHLCLLVSLLRLKKIDTKKVEGLTSLKNKLDRLSDDSISFASKLRLVRSSIIYKPSDSYDEQKIAEEVFKKAQDFVNTVIGIL